MDTREQADRSHSPHAGVAAGGQRTKKTYFDGTDRLVAPDVTLERVRPYFAEAGITRVANLTGLDRVGLPVYSVARPNARSLCVAQGKGLTHAAAMASGAMEALESFHAETITLPLRLASRLDMERAALETWSEGLARVEGFPFDEDSRVLWIEAHRFPAGDSVFVPYETVHTDYRVPLPAGSGRFLMSSNGLASGNHLFEALSHGICELIERDSTTLWFLSGARRNTHTRLDLESIRDPHCVEVIRHFERANVAVLVWDTTSDVGVPAFLCEVADRAGSAFRPLGARRGMGCHPRREIALLRALTEAAQTRITVISGARDDLSGEHYDERQEERRRALLTALSEERGGRRFEEIGTYEAASFESDLRFLRDRLTAAGLSQVLYVDLSRAGWPISVVRVLVPGLEPMCEAPGYRPGARTKRGDAT